MAAQRVNYGDHENIFSEFESYLVRNQEGPRILFFGASHINHLGTFVNSPGHSNAFKLAFNNSTFMGVGSSSWDRIVSQVKGEDPMKPTKNQWDPFVALDKKPEYIVISLGSNSVDAYQKTKYGKVDMFKREVHWTNLRDDLNMTFGRLKESIDDVVLFLNENFRDAVLIYVQIAPRYWWGTAAHTLARWLDFYVVKTLRPRYRVNGIWNRHIFASHYHFNEQVMFGMLKSDCVHLNYFGNKALAQVVMRSVLNRWKLKRENAPIKAKLGLV